MESSAWLENSSAAVFEPRFLKWMPVLPETLFSPECPSLPSSSLDLALPQAYFLPPTMERPSGPLQAALGPQALPACPCSPVRR